MPKLDFVEPSTTRPWDRACRHDGASLRVNNRLCDVLGYSRPELLQMSFHDVNSPDDKQSGQAKFNALKRGEINQYGMEMQYVRKDRKTAWVSLTVSLQSDELDGPRIRDRDRPRHR